MSLLKYRPDTNHELRKRIEKLLYDNGISIQRFAEICDISYSALRSILTKEKTISYITRGKIEKVLSEFEFDAKETE